MTRISIIFLLLLSSSLLFSQIHVSDLRLSLGVSVQPAFDLKRPNLLEQFSTSPNVDISFGAGTVSAHVSIGVISTGSLVFLQKFTYIRIGYSRNTAVIQDLSQGLFIETGFNFFFGEEKRLKLWGGSRLQVIPLKPIGTKILLHPFVVGLSFNLLKEGEKVTKEIKKPKKKKRNKNKKSNGHG